MTACKGSGLPAAHGTLEQHATSPYLTGRCLICGRTVAMYPHGLTYNHIPPKGRTS